MPTTRESARPTDDAVRLRRKADRASYDAATVDAILDEALLCHVAFVMPDGRPAVVPMLHARDGDRLLLHGSTASRLAQRARRAPLTVAVEATLVDGLVLARSGLHHSINYRSVVVVGELTVVTGDAAKRAAFDLLVDHVVPGRATQVRAATRRDIAATEVMALELAHASAKVRTGGVNDEPEDLGLPVWAGVLPLRTIAGAPETDPEVPAGVPVPPNVRAHPRFVGSDTTA